MSKKNNLNIIIIILIIVALIALVVIKNTKRIKPQTPINQSEAELNQAAKVDTTQSINDNLNSIKVEDVGADEDLNSVDKELQKL